MLVIQLLGNVAISVGPSAVRPHLMPLPQALLAYLVLHPQRLHARDTLIGHFWDGLDPARARSALNTALWRVRAAIEPSDVPPGRYLTASHDGVGFNADGDAWIDVHVLKRRLSVLKLRPASLLTGGETTELAATLALYTGELLDGMYWDWIVPERERLRLLVLDGMTLLMHVHALHNRYGEALRCGQRIIDLDPLRETVHRDLMRLHCAAGQRGLAVRQYESCRRVLQAELQIEPMPQTRALFEQVVAGETLGPGPWAAATSLHEPAAVDPVAAVPEDPVRRWPAAHVRAAVDGGRPHPYPAGPRRDAARRDLARLGIDLEDVMRLMHKELRPGEQQLAQANS